MDVLAVIPARGGSKRVPRKNIRDVAGTPLIGHTIEQAANAELIDRAVVSTDDKKIQRIAEDYGGTVPFTRPDELATDDAQMPPVLSHALDWHRQHGYEFDVIALLQPTVPLRTPEDIDSTIKMLGGGEYDSVVSVSPPADPPHWMVKKDDSGYLNEVYEPDVLWADDIKRSQQLSTPLVVNGAIFAAWVEQWATHESFYLPKTGGWEIPPERSFDIDEMWELEVVRALMSERPDPIETH